MRLELLTDFPERFQPARRVYIRGSPYTIQRARRHRAGLLIKLEGIDSLEAAEGLRDATLQVPEAEAHQLPGGTYFHFQVIGLKVVTTTGEDLGEVVEILSPGGNDIYVTRGPRGEVLVPAIGDVVKSVDLERGVLTVEPLPGLL